MKKRKIGVFLCLGTLCYMGVIFFLSSQNGESTTALSHGLSAEIAKIFYTVPTESQINLVHMVIRKCAHIFLFFLLGILVSLSLKFIINDKKYIVYSAIIVIMCSFFDEWHKLFIDGRHFDIDESILNTVCGLIGVALLWTVFFIKSHKCKAINTVK